MLVQNLQDEKYVMFIRSQIPCCDNYAPHSAVDENRGVGEGKKRSQGKENQKVTTPRIEQPLAKERSSLGLASMQENPESHGSSIRHRRY